MLYTDDLVLVGKCEEELKEKLRKWNEYLKGKSVKINEDKTKVMCESFGTGTTQVVGNVKRPCSVCLKGVGVNSIRCTQCVQWVHARCSRVKGSLKKVQSSFICRRCKGELSETRQVNSQVNGLHIDWSWIWDSWYILLFRWHAEPGRWLWACNTKKDTDRLVEVQGAFQACL